MINPFTDDTIRRLLPDAIRVIRRRLFTVSRGTDPALIADADADALTHVLAEAGYIHPWLLSYHYEGEDVNLVRFWYDSDDHPDHPHRQDHVRLFTDKYPDGVTGIEPHTEASSVTHPDAHLDEVGFSRDPAIDRIKSHLDHANITYEHSQTGN
jgi:hypothetical protein